jgi:hypothetical protein
MENKLNFTVKRKMTLFAKLAYSSGTITTDKYDVENKTAAEIHQVVINLEKKEREATRSYQRSIIFCYYVLEHEEMTDNREKFGHKNQTSEKLIKTEIEPVYTYGEVKKLSEWLAKIANGNLPKEIKSIVDVFIITDLKIDPSELTEKELDIDVIMIPGEKQRKTFFKKFEEGSSIKLFDF